MSALAVPPSQQTFLAFDYGLKRTGVAVGNRLLKTATPQATIAAEGDATATTAAIILSAMARGVSAAAPSQA